MTEGSGHCRSPPKRMKSFTNVIFFRHVNLLKKNLLSANRRQRNHRGNLNRHSTRLQTCWMTNLNHPFSWCYANRFECFGNRPLYFWNYSEYSRTNGLSTWKTGVRCRKEPFRASLTCCG